jgi:hypothetical protein
MNKTSIILALLLTAATIYGVVKMTKGVSKSSLRGSFDEI